MPGVTERPMFGYRCYLVSGKFFAGFGKNDRQVIVRLPKDAQQAAIGARGVGPFQHGARMGWVEIDTSLVAAGAAMRLVRKAYAHARSLAKND